MLPDPAWGLPAAIATMPAGWKFDGVAEHGDSCMMTSPDIRWAASSPDGVTRIQYYPTITYHYSSNPQDAQRGLAQGCLVTAYWKPEDFLNHVLAPSLHPGAKVQVQVALAEQMPALQQRQQEEANLDRQSRGMRHTQVGFASLAMEYQAGGTTLPAGWQRRPSRGQPLYVLVDAVCGAADNELNAGCRWRNVVYRAGKRRCKA